MLTAALTASVFILSLLSAWLYVSHRAQLMATEAVWRIAMEFIALEATEMPHEFAACFLAKNHEAIAQKFPQWAEFAQDRAEAWDTAE